jgi:uncharacterized RDD family membrane protein YckC
MAVETPFAFFSYARDDAQFALQLAKDLKARGFPVWLDQLDIRPGQRWDKAVEDALASCPRMLVILSPSSVASTNVMDEVSFALEEQKTLIPVLHRDCKIPFRLRRVQYADFRGGYDTGLRDLLRVMGTQQMKVAVPVPIAVPVPAPSPVRQYCSRCGRSWPQEQLTSVGGRPVCPNCKHGPPPKPREGPAPPATFAYAGFWTRFVAALLDGVILFMATLIVVGLVTANLGEPGSGTTLIVFAMFAAYESIFVSRFGATPGKMALKLKVVRSDLRPISLGRAVGRHFAKYLSAVILMAGYIMAGFDPQKRALHDILCDTRVIMVSK